MKTIRAKRNIYGNWVMFIGSERVADFGVEWCAKDWLLLRLEEGGYVLSEKSDITAAELETYKRHIS